HAEFRSWTNSEGVKIDAELVKSEGDNVTLRLRSGKLATVPQAKLSEADREFVKTSNAAAPAAAAAVLDANRKAKWLEKMDKAQEQATQTGLPILVLFTGTSWCPYCIKLEKDVFSEKAFQSFANQNLVLLKLDFGPGGETRNKKDKALQEEYAVKGFPTYFLIDASGKRLAQGGFHDGINPKVFEDWVKAAQKK
ncbi:MAG: thioredoxin family protein, partial [Luteolibacter sp.]